MEKKVPVGGHTFDVDIHGPNGLVPYNFIDNLDGTYKVTYATPTLGPHTIEVKHKNEHIKDSPFSINVSPSLPWAGTSGISGFNFTVQSRDKGGVDKKSGGADLKVAILNQSSGAQTKAQVSDNGDGTYGVSYSLGGESGKYTVSVVLNGNDVAGTPFTQIIN